MFFDADWSNCNTKVFNSWKNVGEILKMTQALLIFTQSFPLVVVEEVCMVTICIWWSLGWNSFWESIYRVTSGILWSPGWNSCLKNCRLQCILWSLGQKYSIEPIFFTMHFWSFDIDILLTFLFLLMLRYGDLYSCY